MKLVFIVGKKRSGKDTAVSIVKKNFKVIDYSLAMPIKDTLFDAWFKLEASGSQKNIPKIFRNDWNGIGMDREKFLPISNQQVYELMCHAVNILEKEYGLIIKSHRNPKEDIIKAVILNNTEAWSIRRLMQTLGTDLIVNHFDRMFWIKLFASKFADCFEREKDFFIVPDTRQEHELAFARAMGATVIHVVRDGNESKDTHITEAGLPIKEGDTVIKNNGTLEEFNELITKEFKSL